MRGAVARLEGGSRPPHVSRVAHGVPVHVPRASRGPSNCPAAAGVQEHDRAARAGNVLYRAAGAGVADPWPAQAPAARQPGILMITLVSILLRGTAALVM
jgi:hypothetical protein